MSKLKVYNPSRVDYFFYRILPGLLTLLLITSPLWTSLLGIYEFLLFYLAFLAAYIFYQSMSTAVGEAIAYRRMHRDQNTDWSGMLENLKFEDLHDNKLLPKNLSGFYPIFFIPVYKEPYDMLLHIMNSIIKQDYPFMKNVIIVIGEEERAGPERRPIMDRLKNEFSKYVKDVWIYYHPANIEGEISGDASANLRWAAVQTSKKLHETGIDSKSCFFIKADSDTRFHPKLLSALTYKYFTDENRLHKFYSPAIVVYSNNFWRVPSVSRLFWSTITLGVAAEWVYDKKKKQSFTCYGASFNLLENINYWDASLGAEDTYFYWNAFLHTNGKFSGEEVYLPITMDCVEGKDLKSSLTSLYKQQLRWGWGVNIMSIALQGMAWNKKIQFEKKLEKFWTLFRTYNFLLTISILLAFTVPILTLINHNLQYSTITYMLPRTMSVVMTLSLIAQLPHKYYIWKLYGAPPKEKSLLFKIYWWGFEHFLFIINIWTYSLFPRLQAQFEMTVGKDRKKFFTSIEGRTN